MKFIYLLAFIGILNSCNSTKKTNKKAVPFNIESATYQNWYGGREGVRGVTIEISVLNTKKKVSFTTVYYLDKKSTITVKNDNGNYILIGNINTSLIKNRKLASNPQNEYGNKAPIKPKYPNLAKDEAVLEYTINDELFYKKIKLTKKKDLFYQ